MTTHHTSQPASGTYVCLELHMACTSQGMCVFRTLTRLAAGEAQQQQKQPQHLQPTRFAHHQPALIAAPKSTTERACLVSSTKHEVLLSFCPLFMLFGIACHVLLYVLCRNKTATGGIYALPFTTAAVSHLLGNYTPHSPSMFSLFWYLLDVVRWSRNSGAISHT